LGGVGLLVLLCVGGGLGVYFARDWFAKVGCESNFKEHLAPQLKKEIDRKAEVKLDELRGTDFWREMAYRSKSDQSALCIGTILKGEQKVYRGPKKPLSEMEAEEPVGCCPRDSHKEGIWVLYKNGRWEFAETGSPAYKRALEELSD
jgi:hypothetical protein